MNMMKFIWTICLSVLVVGSTHAQQADIKLESRITGNQEQPQVLYIVPWKSPGSAGDLYVPLQSQLNTVFDHVERAELVREMHYRQQLQVPVSDNP